MKNERIKVLRKHLRYSQEKFGDIIGKSFSLISSMERGESPVQDDTIDSIVLRLNVRREWLLAGTGEMFSNDNHDVKSSRLEELLEEVLKANRELSKRIDKMMDYQVNQTGKMIDLLGKKPGNHVTAMRVSWRNILPEVA